MQLKKLERDSNKMEDKYDCPKDTPCRFGDKSIGCTRRVVDVDGKYRPLFGGGGSAHLSCPYSDALNVMKSMDSSGIEFCIRGGDQHE